MKKTKSKAPSAAYSRLVEKLRERRQASARRGVALVLVLGALTVLTVFLTELQQDTTAELSAALAERDALRAEYYARSAISLSRLLIVTEPAIQKSVGPIAAMLMGGRKLPQIPVWEFTDMVLGPFNDTSGAEAFNNVLGAADYSQAKNLGLVGGGHFEIKIVDEDSKLNLNEAVSGLPDVQMRIGARLNSLFLPTTYDTMFAGRDPDNQYTDRQTLCGALIDWADFDQDQFLCNPPGTSGSQNGGTEDNFYQTIGMAYLRKNAPYDSLEEVRLVRGVGDDFWATFVDPDTSDPHKRIMTVWGQGTVNVNTANAQTLLTLTCANAYESPFCNDPVQIEAFLEGIALVKSFTQGAPLFTSPTDFVNAMQGKGPLGQIITALGVQPVTFKSPTDVKKGVNTSSKMFSIYADGVVPGLRKTTRVRIHAVVDFRSAGDLGTASFGIGGATPTLMENASEGQDTATTAKSAAATADAVNLAAAGSTDAYMQILGKDPAGRVIYWRVE